MANMLDLILVDAGLWEVAFAGLTCGMLFMSAFSVGAQVVPYCIAKIARRV